MNHGFAGDQKPNLNQWCDPLLEALHSG